ncbi:site-2 protease family protein [Candidatus Peregrinibacteria bacterium CG_4_9_14_0_2_um_filter_53_11]|nr:MAG: site-2 protease family protein [Candidatus Peregrinibacteria bacterium CG_4_9_14_0_2_um_filter_53_11]
MTDLIYTIIAVLFALSFHEFAHAWMGTRLGDPTARLQGRLTLNPLKHLDPVGTFALIFFHFGWGKPVPFNPHNLANPKRDGALIALAGPLTNLLIAIVVAVPLKYFGQTGFVSSELYQLLDVFYQVNIILLGLNLLPLPPFDGSKVLGLFIPRRWYNAYDTYLDQGVTYVLIFILFDNFILGQLFGFSILSLGLGSFLSWAHALISIGT